jgi:hypothetical protein
MSCTTPGLPANPDSLEECQDFDSARLTLQTYNTISYDYLKMANSQCQIPCKSKTYQTTVRHYHKTSWVDLKDHKSDQFYLALAYSTLNVELKTETLVYDFGTMLTAAGGNLGLFLGFSCLTFLLDIIDKFANWCKIEPN